MSWEQPLWLVLIGISALAAFLSWRFLENRRAALGCPETAPVPGTTPRAMAAKMAPALLKGAALILMALALARPRLTTRAAAPPATDGIDIMLAVDTSDSMRALDFDPKDRMTAAKETARNFIMGRSTDRIGVLVFGGAPLLICPLTSDYEPLLELLDTIHAAMTRTDGTAVGDGIAAAVSHLRLSRAKSRVLILLTDGRSNTGAVDPLTAARAAQSLGIKIYAIGTGKKGEAVIPVDTPMGRVLAKIPDELDEDMLSRVAEATNGKYYRATNLKELRAIYAEIDRLEKSPVGRAPLAGAFDLYPRMLLAAALLVFSEMLLARTWLLRLP